MHGRRVRRGKIIREGEVARGGEGGEGRVGVGLVGFVTLRMPLVKSTFALLASQSA